jgi:hypothetical protein
MAHIHRTGPVDIINTEVLLATGVPAADIKPGDFVFASVVSNVAYAKPITNMTWNTDLATTQSDAALVLIGVASGRSRIGTTDTRDLKVLVNMDGTFECDAASAIYNVGQYVGFKKAAGNALLQTLEAVTVKGRACAIVVENTGVAATRIKVRLVNTPPKR